MGGWFKKEIKSVEDLKGLKIRIPGFGGEVMARVGATINTIPTGELYMALEMGTIDSVEWVSPAFDMGLGFHKIAKYQGLDSRLRGNDGGRLNNRTRSARQYRRTAGREIGRASCRERV